MSDHFEKMLQQKEQEKLEAEIERKKKWELEDQLDRASAENYKLNHETAERLQKYFESLPGQIRILVEDIPKSRNTYKLRHSALALIRFECDLGDIEDYYYRDMVQTIYWGLIDGAPATIWQESSYWDRSPIYGKDIVSYDDLLAAIKAHIARNLSEEYKLFKIQYQSVMHGR
jgi:hypothetical protein